MQPELPWNVAGIAPEAREAARASARREGLSVGEWLTRRILRGLTENNPAPDRWWADARPGDAAQGRTEPQRLPAHSPFSMQDSADMLARIARSEGETQNSWRRIEDQLKTLARRLEQTERSQTESSRAVSQATTEMNIAAREHAQALDQLGTHVTGLGDRLSRLEQGAETEGFRDAIKALHQGLSRLADQMSETASHAASQATELATSIETIAGKLAESREDAQEGRQALEDRMAMLAANVSSLAAKILETRDDSGRVAHALETRLTASERAIEQLETDRVASATLEARIASSEHAIEQLEADHTGSEALESEIRKQSTVVKELTDTVDALAQRLPAIDSKVSGNIARLDTAIGGRLLSLENKLSNVTERLQESEHSRPDIGALETDVHGMGVRLDGLETRLKTAIFELESLAREATAKRDIARAAAPDPVAKQTATPQFDLPPFTGFTNATPPAVPHEPEPPPPINDGATTTNTAAAQSGTGAFDAVPRSDAAAGMEFIAAARRSALAAAETKQDERRNFFSWGEPAADPETDKHAKTRVVLLTGLVGVVIVAALLAGIVLSRTFTETSPPAPPLPQVTARAPAKPAVPVASPQAARTETNSVPSTPAIVSSAPAPVAQSAPTPPIHRTHNPRTRSAAISSRLTPPAPQIAKAAPSRTQSPASPSTKLASLASSGNAKAEEILGLQYIDGDGEPLNEAEGAKWLERAALQGEAVAAYRLGTLYERGQGVPADPAKAVQWYSTAAKAGNRKAMHNLAVAYAQGTGVQKDLATAAQWFGRAAALGLADSQFNLAVLYERGMGVPQSLTNAYKWYAIAASQGDVESKTRLEALSSQISADDKATAESAAAAFHPDPLNRIANSPPDAATVLGG